MNQKHNELIINTDGGSRGNPGPAAVGAVCKTTDGTIIFEISKRIGEATNNVAEYLAVFEALDKIHQDKIQSEKIKFILDSKLIVMQITGRFKVKQPHLQDLKSQIKELVEKARQEGTINTIVFSHVLREQNKEADALVNRALDS